jgi:hypothetical protein
VRALVIHRTEDDLGAVCKRRGIAYARTHKADLPRPTDALRAAADEMSIDVLRGLVVELAAVRTVSTYAVSDVPLYTADLLKVFCVDMTTCRKAAKAAAKDSTKAAKKPAKKRSAA